IELYKTINKTKPEVIHTQAQVSLLLVTFLKKINLINNEVKIIHTERGLYKKYNIVIQNIFLFFMNELHTLITTTNYNLKHWKSALERKKIRNNCLVIPNTAGKNFETYDETKEKTDNQTFA